MTSFGSDDRTIDTVNSLSDYTRRIASHEELEDINLFKLLLKWWKQKNQEKQHLPSRKDFNPVEFKEILPNLAIFDLVFKDEVLTDCIPTLIGTELVRVYGETTGILVSEYGNEYVVKTALSAANECLKRREPLGVSATAASGKMPFLSSFALYCPLATDHVHIDKLLIQVSFKKASL